MITKNLNVQRWYRAINPLNPEALNVLLDDEVVFYSPVVFKPVKGKQMTSVYLLAAYYVLGNDTFQYVREVSNENQTVLEFTTTIDGTMINGVDIIEWNKAGKIILFKVMVRPLQGIHKIHELMMAMLEKLKK